MKITFTTAAQCLLCLAACLPAAAQPSIQISTGTKESQVKTLQQQLESYKQQLRTRAELVENARQEAISAGIQGDGAGPFIDAWLQEQKELEALQVAVTPKIEQTRAMVADLTMAAQPSDTAPSPKMKSARPARAVVTASKSHAIR